jgi:hypothetical protein
LSKSKFYKKKKTGFTFYFIAFAIIPVFVSEFKLNDIIIFLFFKLNKKKTIHKIHKFYYSKYHEIKQNKKKQPRPYPHHPFPTPPPP